MDWFFFLVFLCVIMFDWMPNIVNKRTVEIVEYLCLDVDLLYFCQIVSAVGWVGLVCSWTGLELYYSLYLPSKCSSSGLLLHGPYCEAWSVWGFFPVFFLQQQTAGTNNSNSPGYNRLLLLLTWSKAHSKSGIHSSVHPSPFLGRLFVHESQRWGCPKISALLLAS